MKVFCIAGEKSGDDHGAGVMQALRNRNPNVDFQFWGGDAMAQAAQKQPNKHYREHAYMGFWEVFKNLKSIFANLKQCKKEIADFQPDVVVLIDYPGFNLRIAEFVKHLGIPVVYYIAPQLWAWKKNRYKKIKAFVDDLLVILPFEKTFFEELGVSATYLGHPLVNRVKPLESTGSAIGLFPGSRRQEVGKMASEFALLAEQNWQQEFIVGAMQELPPNLYKPLISLPNVKLEYKGMEAVLKQCRAAFVTSGTATLETALHGIPLVVVYKTSKLTYWIARMLIQVPYISLVNLILNRKAAPELIQDNCTASQMSKELNDLLEDMNARKDDLNELRELLASDGDHFDLIAERVEQWVKG